MNLTRSHHFEWEIKRQSVKWHLPATPSAGKVKATVVWDAEGVILIYIMPCGETINRDLYT